MGYKDKQRNREYQHQWFNKKKLDSAWLEQRRQAREVWRKNNPEKVRSQRKRKYLRDIQKTGFREQENKRKQEERLKLKIEAFTHYSYGKIACACCGETEINFLSLDHIENNGAKERRQFRRGGVLFYRLLRQKDYPTGYQVLCMNCNYGKRMNNGICPHQLRK